VEQQCSCRFCNSKATKKLYSAIDIFDESWFIYQCSSCGAYFLAPFPGTAILRKAYDAAYYGTGKNKFIFSVEHFIDFFRKRKAKNISKMIPVNAKLLDIGCGNGRFLKHLSSLGRYELHGTEIEGGSAIRASHINEIKLKIGQINIDDFPENYFDTITLFHVFEHLEKPKETLEIISKILKKNGLLILTFPNISSWQAKLFKGNWYHLDPPRHLIFFNPENFIKIMDTLGFALKKKSYFSFEQNPYGWVQSILNSINNRREFLYERLKGNKTYAPENGFIKYFLNMIFFIFTFPFFAIFDFIESLFHKGATVKMEFIKK